MMGVNFIQPALPALTVPFGVSDSALSLIMTLFTAPAIVLSPIFGIIADLYGRRLLLAGGLIIFGIFGTAMAFAPTLRLAPRLPDPARDRLQRRHSPHHCAHRRSP